MLNLKSIFIGIISLILASVLSLGLAAQPPAKAQKEGTATVSGRVLLKGEPARGVVVMLQPQQQFGPPQGPGLRAKTGADGSYQITGVAAGRYAISAAAPAYVSQDENNFGVRGRHLNISDGEQIEKIDFNLKLGGVITGRVTGVNGRPIVDENVQLWNVAEQGPQRPFNTGQNYYMFRTDDRGIYRLYGVPAGKYKLSVGVAQREGGFYMTSNRAYNSQTYHPETTEESQAKVLELIEGDELTNIDIKLGEAKKTFDVFGRVIDAETGAPIIGISVSYGTYQPGGRGIGGWGGRGERSDAQGEFQMQGAMPGKYAAFATPESNSDFYSEVSPFEITDSDIHGIEVKVRRGGSISGTMTLEGVSDPKLFAAISQLMITASSNANGMNPPRQGNNTVNPNGSFRVNGLRAGKVTLSVFHRRREPGFFVQRVERNGVPQNDGVEVSEGEQVGNVRIVVGYGAGVVRGQIKIIGGSLPEGLQLYVYAQRMGQQRGSGLGGPVDARGLFLIEGLAPGEYELRVSPMSSMNQSPEMQKLLQKIYATRQQMHLDGGEAQVTLVVNLTEEKKENER